VRVVEYAAHWPGIAGAEPRTEQVPFLTSLSVYHGPDLTTLHTREPFVTLQVTGWFRLVTVEVLLSLSTLPFFFVPDAGALTFAVCGPVAVTMV
jgi:hypothetical protein